jgi:hypothetical protein
MAALDGKTAGDDASVDAGLCASATFAPGWMVHKTSSVMEATT